MKTISLQAIILTLCLITQAPVQAQTWTPLKNPNPSGGTGTMMLLTDGTVIAQGPGETNAWTKLTPDNTGNYVNGTWSNIASMSIQRLYFGSVVLPSGKVFVLGGEYSSTGGFNNTGEIYDPVANTWTSTANFPQTQFGDDPTVLLNTGKVLCGYLAGPQTYLYDPAKNTFSQTGTKLQGDASDEETFLQMSNGNILTYSIFASPPTGPGSAQQYNPSTGQWSSAGIVPVPLSGSAFGYELGPGAPLPDGRYIYIGANNNTAIYTPSTNTWVAGPTLPAKMGADDAPGAMLPNGHFLFAADTSVPIFTAPTHLFDFDYTTNTLTDVTPTTGALATMLNAPSFIFRMLLLPNGHMLFGGANSATLWDYTPAGSPQTSWQPVITNITQTGIGTYILTGTQLTGISEGATYGDDVLMSTNYPIVRLKNSSGKVFYARTTNWTPGVATGNLSTSVQFTTPTGLANGIYQVTVSASGISSAAKTLNIGVATSTGTVTAAFTAGTNTLVLQGDANSNMLTLTYTPTTAATGVLKVEGATGTSIGLIGPGNTVTAAPSYSFNLTGPLTLNADLGAGDDSIGLVNVVGSTVILTLDAGNDNASLSLCKIGTLNANGGTGTNTLLLSSSSITNLIKAGF